MIRGRTKKNTSPPPALVACITEDEGGCLFGYQVGTAETGTWVPLVIASPVYLSFEEATHAGRQAHERAEAAVWKRYRKNQAQGAVSGRFDDGPGAA